MDKTETTMKEDQEKRDKEFEKFQMNEEDLKGAIAAITKAMEYLEASKAKLSNAKVSMLRQTVRNIAAAQDAKGAKQRVLKAVDIVMNGEPSSTTSGRAVFLEQPQAKANAYGSNDIIDMLRELRREFSKNLADLVADEQQTNGDFELKQQAAGNSVKGHKKSIAMSQEIQGAKSDSKSGKEQLLEETENALDEDVEYQEEMTSKCEDKAKAWDERSTTRSKELTAISEALGILKGTVSEKYSANKKLVGLLSKKSVGDVDGQADDEEEDPQEAAADDASAGDSDSQGADSESEEDDEDDAVDSDLSFLQRAVRRRKHAGIRRQAVAYLARQARQLKSEELSALLLHLKADHFVKVRGLINDMIARLEAQASEEADQKAFCDEAMGEGITKRDEAQQDIEQANADITKFTAEEVALREDIAKLGEQIAELHKALKEAQELRDEESRNNEQTVADSKEGLEAVENAIQVLKEFYESAGASFVQQGVSSSSSRKRQRPEAPETFEDDYAGKQDASKGIIGLLEVIKSDFERNIKTTEDGEAEAKKEFDQFHLSFGDGCQGDARAVLIFTSSCPDTEATSGVVPSLQPPSSHPCPRRGYLPYTLVCRRCQIAKYYVERLQGLPIRIFRPLPVWRVRAASSACGLLSPSSLRPGLLVGLGLGSGMMCLFVEPGRSYPRLPRGVGRDESVG